MDISKIVSVADTAVKKSEGLLSALFGSRFKENDELHADQVRFRRFENQVQIFSKASDLLQEKGIKAKPIALKYLVPLIDLSSVEEDPNLQAKWANIIANLSTYNSMELFNKNCIELLGKLSAEEIYLMDSFYSEFILQRGEVVENRDGKLFLKDYRAIFNEDVLFDPWEIAHRDNLDDIHIKLYIENMIASGLLQFEEISLEDDDLVKSFNVHLTYLGLYFVRLCKYF